MVELPGSLTEKGAQVNLRFSLRYFVRPYNCLYSIFLALQMDSKQLAGIDGAIPFRRIISSASP